MDAKKLRPFLRRSPPGSGIFTHHKDRYERGNVIGILEGGRHAFDVMLGAIESATKTVHLESYIFDGKTARRFADCLAAAARRQVSVRLIYDSLGSLDMDRAVLGKMHRAGVQILEYHPVAPWRARWSWWRRDHRKILVVDGCVAFTGGINISDVNLPSDAGGAGWRDLHFRMEGPAVYELDRLFRTVWFKETGSYFPLIMPEYPKPPGKSAVWVAANQEFLHRTRIRNAYQRALWAAREEVLLAHSYFLPGRRLRRALAAAARRGVRVKVLVPGKSDISSVWLAARSRYDYLLSRGVRLFEWDGPLLHEKVAVVDGIWSAVGSYNMDHQSLMHNLEVNLHILDPAFSRRLADILAADMAESREISLSDWRQRPLQEKILERFFFQLRYFL
ncbi:MAG TPA: phospholipase D-like domain-containing protein [Elusimicrobiota bacterium]|nr:phospholipase D-like domain-containing protein [Elusimicrobiota bacterium]